MGKLPKQFYQQSAFKLARQFLGKFLVYRTPDGKLSGKIIDVEVYATLSGDDAAHGNRRTARTEVMFGEGGHAYVYLTYGMHHLLGIVVNRPGVPEVVFIRQVVPAEGVSVMEPNFGRRVLDPLKLADGPGKLCKSFGITKELNGIDVTGNTLWLEDRGVRIGPKSIRRGPRIGLNPKLASYATELRFYVDSAAL